MRKYTDEEKAEMARFLDKIGLEEKVTSQKAKEMASLFTTVVWDNKYTRKTSCVLAKLQKLQLDRRRAAGLIQNGEAAPIPPDVTDDSLESMVCALVKQARLVNDAAIKLFKVAENIKTALERDRTRLKAYTQIRAIIEKDVPEILRTR